MEETLGSAFRSVVVPPLLLALLLLLQGAPARCAAPHERPTSSAGAGGLGEVGTAAAVPDLPMAVYEQKYYLQRLFTRYGQEGHLSLDALQKLLVNLGIGEIRVLEDQEEDHDHDEDHDQDHDQENDQDHDRDHGRDRGDGDAGRRAGHDGLLGPMDRRRGGSSSATDGAGDVGPRTAAPTGGAGDWRGPPRGAPRGARGAREVPHGGGAWGAAEKQSRTAVQDYLASLGLSGDHGHIHEECMNITTLLWNYGMSSASGVNQDQFIFLCPAMLYQIDSRVCVKQQHDRHGASGAATAPDTGAAAWGWGFLAITAISLLSLLAAAFIPALSPDALSSMLGFLVALAVGTLSGDALLHLLPHAQGGGHGHKPGGAGGDWTSGLVEQLLPLGKGMAALGGVYLMFLLDSLLPLLRVRREEKKREAREVREGGEKAPPCEELELKVDAACRSGGSDAEKVSRGDRDPERRREGRAHGGGLEQHRGHSHAPLGKAGRVGNIAWMVIMGDGLHNFTDGLAIGAAFSSSVTVGLSTSIAVLCHEVPHELGDFAVLLRAGMSLRRAVFYNLLSALLGYLGMAIGVAVGRHLRSFTLWIFALTAGCFLYVALVSMLPELRADGRGPKGLGRFLLQNAGLLLGFAIMFLIALFEDSIALSLSF
ncbi:zinc transporter ZIP5-like [Petromyzon marinus]|nr:zinc transporter ZIP10-like isoform X2 [Petromyzon marinus]XP_032824605.1 zinc transporter ZIP10-like isoform X2 [Petromyzon marinus]